MCGIVAVAGKNLPQREVFLSAVDTLHQRGPDDRGAMHFNTCLLGHTRLAIIDTEGGHQPIRDTLHNTAITFNGEIYNYKSLRTELEARGHRFLTQSDTEVILKAYAQYGTDCVRKLDGMFAFALWDERDNSLFLARDRFGKKPLYYCVEDETIYVASELKTLRTFGLAAELCGEAVDNYLYLRYVPSWKSIYKNIFQIPPAHMGVFSGGRMRTFSRYWDLEQEPLSISYGEAKEEVRRLLTAAVHKRTETSDVEVGALLSGGVDSTLVLLIASDFLKYPLKTFSLGYGTHGNELPYADHAARAIHSQQHTLRVGEGQIQALEKITAYFDEPHAGTANFPQHLISEVASRTVKVVLSGEGGDELFLGYRWYARHLQHTFFESIYERMFRKPYDEQLRAIGAFSAAERAELWGSAEHVNKDILAPGVRMEKLNDMQRANLFDITTHLPGQHLARVDRTSMMHGLEVRCPLLDTELVEFVCRLPIEYKATAQEQKILLKDLLTERMPHAFVYRHKQGFDAPIARWLKEPTMHTYVLDLLGSSAHIRSLFDDSAIDSVVRGFYGSVFVHGVHSSARRLWTLLCLEIWLRSVW